MGNNDKKSEILISYCVQYGKHMQIEKHNRSRGKAIFLLIFFLTLILVFDQRLKTTSSLNVNLGTSGLKSSKLQLFCLCILQGIAY
jgi:hypothetical protein